MVAVPSDLAERWLAAWPLALAAWGSTSRLSPPELLTEHSDPAPPSFAWYSLRETRVHIDLTQVLALGLQDHAVAVLAHEIGHHLLAPADGPGAVRAAHRVRLGLVDCDHLVPSTSNLWADLVINDRLQRTGGADVLGVWRTLAVTSPATDPVMGLVLRGYELLWGVPAGTLAPTHGPSAQSPGGGTDRESAALLLARLVRAYRHDPVTGAGGFASLVRTYLGQVETPRLPLVCVGTGPAEQGLGLGADPSMRAPVLHPALDPAVTGLPVPADPGSSADEGEGAGTAQGGRPHGTVTDPDAPVTAVSLHATLAAMGSGLTLEEVTATLLHEAAVPHLVPYPHESDTAAPESIPGPHEVWDVGEDLADVDWSATVVASPVVVPGVTTRRRAWVEDSGSQPERRAVDLDLYVDSSGSMPDPRHGTAAPTLAAAVLVLSALRDGAAVRVTVWSGEGQVASTGFRRQPRELLVALATPFNGGTSFPLHVLRHSYPRPVPRPRHLAVISDDGLATMFPAEGPGAGLAHEALRRAGGGGSLVLNVVGEVRVDHGDYDVYRVGDGTIVEFARGFARRWWGGQQR